MEELTSLSSKLNMDGESLSRGIMALQWEFRYRQKIENIGTKGSHFLARETQLDPDFEQFFDKFNIVAGEVLDIGTGRGEQAIFMAQKGFRVTATDISVSAISKAKEQGG